MSRLLLSFVILIAPIVARAAPDPFEDFAQKNRCAIADRLSHVFDYGDPAVEHQRFLAVSSDRGYVQCIFHDRERMMFCEASSGFYEAPRRHLPAAKIAALHRLGFSTDDHAGNFTLDRPVAQPLDVSAIGDLYLRALYDAYDARAENALELVAPFAPDAPPHCDPVS